MQMAFRWRADSVPKLYISLEKSSKATQTVLQVVAAPVVVVSLVDLEEATVDFSAVVVALVVQVASAAVSAAESEAESAAESAAVSAAESAVASAAASAEESAVESAVELAVAAKEVDKVAVVDSSL